MNNLKKIYLNSWNYLCESKKEIYLVVGLFLFSVIIGFIFPSNFSSIERILRELIEKTSGMSGIEITIFIFLNNLQSSFAGVILGAALGIFPIFTAILNGIVVGYVLAKSWSISGIAEFWRLLPHGIFELPALFISLGMGVRLGDSIVNKKPWETFKSRFYYSMLVFLYIVLPLLLVAAIIEGLLITFYR